MTELATSLRSDMAGTLRPEHAERAVTLAGWVHRLRDLGHLVFLDLRDRSGMVQVSLDPGWTPAEVLAAARRLGPEDVVRVEGVVHPRVDPNPEMETGAIEVRCDALELISPAEPLPIPVYRSPREELPGEELRLRHRYLDLRRPELQRNLVLRHRTAQLTRSFLSNQGFLEVETPLLTRPTPEGARDYLVPSRVHPGEFYSLPQSPQLYKQLLMVSGLDRYFQIARCLRDEDLRADRQPEFTQIDAEMSFVDEEDVYRVAEGMVAAIWRDILGVELERPFPRLTHAEALLRYGSDKPDLRFDLSIMDLTELLGDADFRIFQAAAGAGERIRGMRVPAGASLSRKELDRLQEVARAGGAPGALWVKRTEDGYSGQFARALADREDRFAEATGMEPGDLFVAVVGPFLDTGGPAGETREPALDELRRHLAAELELVDTQAHRWLWVTDFPLFEWDVDGERLAPAHHPFTMPHADDVGHMVEVVEGGDAAAMRTLAGPRVRSRAYDAVYNGHELASGSIRIHDRRTQAAIFRALGIGEEEAKDRFGFLLEALRFGTPPHAGFAFGFDRMVMLLAGAKSLREVIAFPKTTAARALFEGAPTTVDDSDLGELGIRRAVPAGTTGTE
jgi:aspartyl-tRNA synthetase